jgi:hypothetical protein
MENSPFARFIERVKGDEDLRQRVYHAEEALARDIEGHTDVITRIAAEAGYDITGWNGRPEARSTRQELEAGDSCTLTCCASLTSTL